MNKLNQQNNLKPTNMSNSRLFQYAVLWHPTEKQVKEEGLKSKLIVDLTTILSADQQSVMMTAAMGIPSEYREQLDQIEIAVRPF
jgi:hypothetical protein